MEPIKDGLKCWLEGSDLTSSSTNWNDKSGNNNNFSIIGTPVAQNNMAVFSENWYAKIDNLNINHGTIELTAVYDETTNQHVFGSWEKNNWRFAFGKYHVVIRNKNNPTSTLLSNNLMTSQNVQYGDIVTYGIAYNEGTYNIFLNGRIVGNANSPDIPTITSFYLGYKSDSNEKGTGNIKSLKIYDRKLEPYEILANYQYELLNRNTNWYVNENNLPKIVDKLSNASNIKITGNKYGNRVQTVVDKIVEKADDVTKAIKQEVINNSYSFKVGTGNVDVSSDVEDGFVEVGIKGVTYQNILKSFDDSKWTGNHIEKNGNQCKLIQNSTSEYLRFRTNLIKKNTKYTLIYTVTENTMVDLSLCINGENVSSGENCIDSNIYIPNVLGTHIVTFTSSSLSDKTIKYFRFAIRSTTEDGTYVVLKNPILLEGDHTNNPNLPSYFEGIVGVGDKSKNLFDNTNIEQGTSSYAVGFTWNSVKGNPPAKNRCRMINPINIKPNTSYTIESKDDVKYAVKQFDKDGIGIHDVAWLNNTYKFTTLSNANYLVVMFAKKDDSEITVNEVQNYKIQLEEGSTATPYEPYYNGHKIEILSNGNNLFNRNEVNFNRLYIPETSTGGEGVFANATGLRCFTIEVVQNTQYCVSIGFPIGNFRVFASYDYPQANVKAKCLMATGGTSISFNTENYQYITVVYYSYNNDNQSGKTEEEVIQTIQLELGTTKSSYESYKEDKKQIFLNEPLMKLPNGACDEITKDGKLIRRIKKVVVDSSKEWRKSHESYDSDTNITFDFIVDNITNGWTTGDNKICNILLSKSGNKSAWNGQSEGISNDMYSKLFITLNKSKLQSQNIQSLKAWLDSNPVIIVYYELKTPIITDLSESQIRMFKDGVIKFDTLVAPESTHYVQLNKSGQIQNAIKESQSLDNRINVLENNYDNLMLSTISRLNDLELDYTLK